MQHQHCYSLYHLIVSESSEPLKLAFFNSFQVLTATNYEHYSCQLRLYHSCHACCTWYPKLSVASPSQLSCFAIETLERGNHSETAYLPDDLVWRPGHLVCESGISPVLRTCLEIPVALLLRFLTVRQVKWVSWQNE